MKNKLKYLLIPVLFFILTFGLTDIAQAKSRSGGYKSSYKSLGRSSGFSSKSVSVKGYTRKNGTYVAPHYRSAPGSKSSSYYKTSASTSSGLAPSNAIKVKGYYRKDGTYVRPHYRSTPDSDKSNNFGKPSYQQKKEYEGAVVLPTYRYDYDKDGRPNYLDKDDDNDAVLDNKDKAQYNPNS